jgi:hypothetical protein
MTRKAPVWTGLVALALSMAFGAPAFASIMYRSGTACVAGKNDASKVNYSQFGIQNESSSSSAKVWCPVLYDRDDSGNILDLGITVFDQNSTSGKDVSCTVYGIDPEAGVGYNPPSQHTSGALSTAQTIVFPDVPSPGFFGYTFSCSLPLAPSSSKLSRVSVYGPLDHD